MGFSPAEKCYPIVLSWAPVNPHSDFDRSPVLESPDLKDSGAYYTPPQVARSLVQWVTQGVSRGSVLDPSCGDGRFLADLKNAVGVEIDPAAAKVAANRPNRPSILNRDFFDWAARAEMRFTAAVGNPPFIRYHRFNGETRARALTLCRSNGVPLTGLASSWAAFVVGASGLLHEGGRIGFVVPAEIGYAVYARPLVQYLLASFDRVEVIAIREKFFPELSEDCWLLRARGFGSSTTTLHFAKLERFDPDESVWAFEPVSRSEMDHWSMRLRPFLLDRRVRDTYRSLAQHRKTKRLGAIARVGIGYVTGANDFFHLRPSQATRLGIPRDLLRVAVRSNRDLVGSDIDESVVARWLAEDRPVLLLDLAGRDDFPRSVLAYLDSSDGRQARSAYKCRCRDPWYVVPDARPPDAFLTIMSGLAPRLVGNSAQVICTNSVHAVRFSDGVDARKYLRGWNSLLTTISCEIEGHALGGGLLKIEPAEAREVLMAPDLRLQQEHASLLSQGVTTLRKWRDVDATRAT